MLVCICANVPESTFIKALEETGGDWQLAAFHTGAGQCCGTCRPFLSEVANQAVKEKKINLMILPALDTRATA